MELVDARGTDISEGSYSQSLVRTLLPSRVRPVSTTGNSGTLDAALATGTGPPRRGTVRKEKCVCGQTGRARAPAISSRHSS